MAARHDKGGISGALLVVVNRLCAGPVRFGLHTPARKQIGVQHGWVGQYETIKGRLFFKHLLQQGGHPGGGVLANLALFLLDHEKQSIEGLARYIGVQIKAK